MQAARNQSQTTRSRRELKRARTANQIHAERTMHLRHRAAKTTEVPVVLAHDSIRRRATKAARADLDGVLVNAVLVIVHHRRPVVRAVLAIGRHLVHIADQVVRA